MHKLIFALLLATSWSYADTWQPTPGHTQIPLWPGEVPDALAAPGPEEVSTSTDLIAGKPVVGVRNVTLPTMTVYQPKEKNTGVSVLVFPGGGFEVLAMDLEGTEVCDWLTSKGITCVLLKYRVPSLPYDWHCKCRHHNLMISPQALDDAQRAMGLLRLHAKDYNIDPKKIGVLGFSAGGYLVAEISTNYKERHYKPIDEADKESCRPDFAVPVYPGHLFQKKKNYDLNPSTPVTAQTPPTFIVQAEDDHVDGVDQALVYYIALKKAGVPTEMHLYAEGNHAFGLRRTKLPITNWPDLVEVWLQTLGLTKKLAD